MIRLTPKSVRVRLTLWHIAVMLAVLGVYAAGVYTFVRNNSLSLLDERLHDDFDWASDMLAQRPDGPLAQNLNQLIYILFLGLPGAVAISGLGGYLLARRALAPIERMSERARSINAERLNDRLPVDNPDDELGRLATVFNDTLTRLESSFEQMRRFTADASHELRTPLTAIRSVGEVGLRGKRDETAYREIIGSMLEEVDRLALLVDRLLMLSRGDTGRANLSTDVVDIPELAKEVAEQLSVLAEEKGQSVQVRCDAVPR